ncbi:nitroreductase [Flavobacterium cheongpyeongense]|uniref:Nitroreductase n=1 Tax=Flavobacterium cheongpyeongense TaxID=2212651 RepID=A0A2V4BU78_9FLAO|nr:nitroreductase family protein [Flavobacterium cheongpyeongense]PXY42545.1 nitroreductase [Flavobacterium cheongpyeongense]
MIRKFYHKFKFFYKNILPSYFIGSPFMSSLYYLLFSSKFKREERAVLAGRIKHIKETNNEKANMYTLIRNVHRIEKGLLMRPRKDIFGLDFIVETINNFETLYVPSNCIPNSQIKWTYDVLSEYFSITGSNPVLDVQRERFKKITVLNEKTIPTSIPYKRIESDRPSISYEEFYKLTKYRRSVRWFLNKKVPHELLDKAVLAANQAPTACNRQPYEYRIIDDPELLEVVRKIPMGLKGYEHNIPVMIVVVGNLDAYFDERDRHVIYVDASLANMSFIFALETLGLSSCAVNWPDIEDLELKMEKVLSLEKHQRPIMCIAVGYPDPEGMVAYSEKRDIELIRKYN